MRENWLPLIGLILGVALLGSVLSPVVGANPTGFPQSWTTPNILPNPDGYYNCQQTGIWVTGEGRVSVVPDVAILGLGVEAQAETVEQAMGEAATAMDAIMQALLANGVAEEDIRTRWFSIYPVWRYIGGYEIFDGYHVTNMITVKIRDMDNVGHIIDAAAKAGGDLTRISWVSFMVDDPSQYYEQALAEAVLDAKAKAELMAELTGVQLGAPIYISEGWYYPYYLDYGYRVYTAEGFVTTPISPGETEIYATVQIVFSIVAE